MPSATIRTTRSSGAILPDAFKGFLTEASIGFLRDHGFPAKVETLQRQAGGPSRTAIYDAVLRRRAADRHYVEGREPRALIDALLEANSLWYPLRYPGQFGDGNRSTPTIHYHYPTPDDIDEILEPAHLPRFRRRQPL